MFGGYRNLRHSVQDMLLHEDKHATTDFLWGKTQSHYKDHELKAVTWNNLFCKAISAEREISPNHMCIFLDFVHRLGSYVKGLPKTK